MRIRFQLYLILIGMLIIINFGGIAECRVVSFDCWYSNVALLDDGSVWIWGCGNPVPTRIDSLSNVTQAVATKNGTVVLKNDGTVWMYHTGEEPVQAMDLSDVKQIRLLTVLKNDGTVWRWLIDPFTFREEPELIQVQGLADIVSITNYNALKKDGTVWDYKTNKTYSASSEVPITDVVAISEHMALKNDGTVWTWGDNSYGQYGDGSREQSNVPVQAKGLKDIVSISTDGTSSLALDKVGTLWAWGDNSKGQLGIPSIGDYSLVPVVVQGMDNVDKIYSGGMYSIVSKKDGTVWAWGINTNGELGDGTITPLTIMKPHGMGKDYPVKTLLNAGPYQVTPTPPLSATPDASPDATTDPVTTTPTPPQQNPTGTPTTWVTTNTPVPMSTQADGYDFTTIIMLIGMVSIGSLAYSIARKK